MPTGYEHLSEDELLEGLRCSSRDSDGIARTARAARNVPGVDRAGRRGMGRHGGPRRRGGVPKEIDTAAPECAASDPAGSVLKPLTFTDRPDSEPVQKLRYFEGLLDEVRSESIPASYRQHLEFALGQCECYWRDRTTGAPGRARPIWNGHTHPEALRGPHPRHGRNKTAR